MLSSRTGRSLFLLLFAVVAGSVAIGLYVEFGSFTLMRMASPTAAYHLDFDTFWHSAAALLEGRDIYRTGAAYPNLNPPLMTVVLAPIGLLEFLPAYRLFLLITVALFVGCMAAVAVELRLPPAPATAVTAAALVSSPVLGTLGLGQVYGLLAAGLVVAWIAARRGREVVSAVALGVVVALKPSLAAVLLLPALRGRRAASGVAVGVALAATGAGSAVAGHSSFSQWWQAVADRPVQTSFDNASLPVTILRLTSPTDWSRPLLLVPGGFAVGCVLAVALVVVTGWRIRVTSPSAAGADLWALAAASLLASPITWHNYLMLLMPALLVLVARGGWPTVTLLLGLALIGMEWPPTWYLDGSASAVPLSLYGAILLCYWTAFVVGSGAPEPVVPAAAAAAAAVAAAAAAGPDAGPALVEPVAARPARAGRASGTAGALRRR